MIWNICGPSSNFNCSLTLTRETLVLTVYIVLPNKFVT